MATPRRRPTPLASVIVPARDAEQTLPRTLECLATQDLDGAYEVIVVDDGSADGTADAARRAPGPVTVLEQPPAGAAAARNRGVDRSRAVALAFCDADVYPTAGWLRAGLEALEAADIVQGKVLPDPDEIVGPFDRSLWITSEVGLFETANLFATRDTFEQVGGFEAWLEHGGGRPMGEDVWFGYRSLRAGARSAFCPQALAYHAVFPRSWSEYVRERPRLRYFPPMARKVPELRKAFFYQRVFLNRRSASFDLALAGVGVAALRRSPVALSACVPYLHELRRHSLRARPAAEPRAAVVALADLLADAVGFGALVQGSLRWRSPVL
jgi:glycosyltransferase involved in cell wall biosynthesis